MNPPTRPWRRAALWLLVLGTLFYSSYGLANWLAGQRAHVPSIVFSWEHAIPFIAWTIVPYWSVNAFYALSLFVCRDRRELDTHALRLLTAQVVAVVFFIATPLAFSFSQPQTEGLPGLLFAALKSFDRPYNQAPSLHITLLVILWALYAVHTPNRWRWLLHAWFALVGASVLTTYQHHFIDIPTGALLGFLCLWLWPQGRDSPLKSARLTDNTQRLRIAWLYVLGACLLAIIGSWLGGWALWLLWPSVSLLLVALNYLVFGPSGFEKDETGSMRLAVRWLLAPYLFGAWVNSRLWTLNKMAAVRVDGEVWIGRFPDRRVLRLQGFEQVFDLTAELPKPSTSQHWKALPMLDLVPPSIPDLQRAAQTIEDMQRHGRVLVVCALGYTRSASAIALWLWCTDRAGSLNEAIERVQQAAPHVRLTKQRDLLMSAGRAWHQAKTRSEERPA